MESVKTLQKNTAFANLRRFIGKTTSATKCNLCSNLLCEKHQHLLSKEKIICVCGACATLFSSQSSETYKHIPQQVFLLEEFFLTKDQWDLLNIPIGIAFFFQSSLAKKVMLFYPSPAGAIESLLNLNSWEKIKENNIILTIIKPDVEALLVNRLDNLDSPEYYLVPIDECYKLVGLIRSNWQGLSGGTKVWEEVNHFFSSLKERAKPIKQGTSA